MLCERRWIRNYVFAQLLGLNAAGETIFYLSIPDRQLGYHGLIRLPHSSGKHQIPDSRTSSA